MQPQKQPRLPNDNSYDQNKFSNQIEPSMRKFSPESIAKFRRDEASAGLFNNIYCPLQSSYTFTYYNIHSNK